MTIESCCFGVITVDGTQYQHDIVIRMDGSIVKRRKRLSKAQFGTSHKFSEQEAAFVYEEGCKRIIIGSGQNGRLTLMPEAEFFFKQKGCIIELHPTPEAVKRFNQAEKGTVGLFHTTC